MSGTSIGNRYVSPLQQVVDPQGIPYVGAKLYTYATGTSVFQNAYSDALCTVPLSNPILTNSAGFFPNIFLIQAPAYRLRLEDPDGGVIWDCDPCSGVPTTGFGNYVPGFVPVGAIQPFASPTPPAGWLYCDGSSVSRTVFAALFAVIGTTFGPGDGATTFSLPDLRGRVALGADGMGGVSAGRVTFGVSGIDGGILGSVGGNERMQSHQHPITDVTHTHTDDGHSHPMDPQAVQYPHLGGGIYGVGVGGSPYDYDFATVTIGYAAIHEAATGLSHTDNNGDGASQNMPPVLVVSYLIFAG